MNEQQRANLLRWIEDLETTTEPQTKFTLHRLVPNEEDGYEVGYCCLGRACVVMNVPEGIDQGGDYGIFDFDNSKSEVIGRSTIPIEWFMEMFSLGNSSAEILMSMNDSHGKTFREIAQYLRDNYL